MKLTLQLRWLAFLALCGCQPLPSNPNNTEASMPVSKASANHIDWQFYGELPAPVPQQTSIGISAAFTGMLGNYLLVAGGANFPDGHPFFDQATKTYYADLWLFDTRAQTLQPAQHLQLPYPVAHGSLVQTEQGVLLVGGQNAEGALASIIEIRLVDGKALISHFNQLPFSWHSGNAAWFQGELFLFGGERNGQPTSGVCRFDPQTTQCAELAPIPGPARVQFPAQQLGTAFYLFGGIDPKGLSGDFTRTDAYAFDLTSLQWSPLASVSYQQQPFSVSGGAAVALNDDEILLLGGVNLKRFNDTLLQFGQLQGDALTKFKTHYFNLTAEEINFSRQQLIFTISTNQWHAIEQPVPFNGGAGPLTVARTPAHIYWIGGETKPGVRSPHVYRGAVPPASPPL